MIAINENTGRDLCIHRSAPPTLARPSQYAKPFDVEARRNDCPHRREGGREGAD